MLTNLCKKKIKENNVEHNRPKLAYVIKLSTDLNITSDGKFLPSKTPICLKTFDDFYHK